MTAFSGRRVAVGVGLESKSTLAPVDPKYWFATTERNFQRTQDKIMNEQSIGSRFATQSTRIVRDHATGNIAGIVNPDNFPVLLHLILGGDITSAKTGSGNTLIGTHTITNDDSTFTPPFTTYIQNPVYNERYKNCQAGNLTLNVSANDFVTFTADIMGKTGETQTKKAVSYVEPEHFASGDIKWQIGATSSSLGADSLKIKSLSINTDGNSEAYGTVTSTDYETFVAKTLKCTGQFVMLFEDTTVRDLWLKNTIQAVKLTLTGASNIGTTTTKYSVEITLPKIRLTNVVENRGTDDIQELTVDYAVESNEGGDNKSITAVVKNNREEYA